MKRAYVTVATENYHYLAIALGKSINLFSVYPLHVFCVNYYPEDEQRESDCFFHRIDYEVWENERSVDYTKEGNFYVNRNNPRSFQVMTRKYEACLRMIEELDYDECCFVDCDSLVLPNIDQIFAQDLSKTETPLFSLGPHEFMMVTDGEKIVRGSPFENSWPEPDITGTVEWPLMQFLQMDVNQRGSYKTCNLFLFNKNCSNFLKDTESFLDSLWRWVDVFYYAPFQDETVLNVLLWKKKAESLPLSYINLEGFQTVKHFYENEVESDEYFGSFYLLPAEKQTVKVLHGEKRQEELDKILDFVSNKAGLNSNQVVEDTNKIIIDFSSNPSVNIVGDYKYDYLVEFINKETGEIIHRSSISNGMWTACERKNNITWQIKINGKSYSEHFSGG